MVGVLDRETNWKYEQMSSNVSEIEQKFQQASQQVLGHCLKLTPKMLPIQKLPLKLPL